LRAASECGGYRPRAEARYAYALADSVEPQAPEHKRSNPLGDDGQHEPQRRERDRSYYPGNVNGERLYYLIQDTLHSSQPQKKDESFSVGSQEVTYQLRHGAEIRA
jgi:hypothetical protein